MEVLKRLNVHSWIDIYPTESNMRLAGKLNIKYNDSNQYDILLSTIPNISMEKEVWELLPKLMESWKKVKDEGHMVLINITPSLHRVISKLFDDAQISDVGWKKVKGVSNDVNIDNKSYTDELFHYFSTSPTYNKHIQDIMNVINDIGYEELIMSNSIMMAVLIDTLGEDKTKEWMRQIFSH